MPSVCRSARAHHCRRLDRILAPARTLPRRPPAEGWVRHLRAAIGLPGAELARALGVTRQAVSELERRERTRGITLHALASAAEALDCDLVYVLLPRHPLEGRARPRRRVSPGSP